MDGFSHKTQKGLNLFSNLGLKSARGRKCGTAFQTIDFQALVFRCATPWRKRPINAIMSLLLSLPTMRHRPRDRK